MVAKIERTPEEKQAVQDWLHLRAREARELRRQNPNAWQELDDLIQQILDPDVVFGLRIADAESKDEDSELDG